MTHRKPVEYTGRVFGLRSTYFWAYLEVEGPTTVERLAERYTHR